MNPKEHLIGYKFNKNIFELDDVKYTIKEMTIKESTEYEMGLLRFVKGEPVYNTENAKTKLVILTLCDENGKRIFDNSDIATVNALPASVVNKIYNLAVEINSLDPVKSEKN